MRRKKESKGGLVFVAFLFAMLCIAAGVYFYFFMPNNNVIAAFDEGRLNLVVESQVDTSKSQPKVVDNEILFPFDTVKKYFDSNIYWDDALKKVTVTTDKKVIRMKSDSLDALINNNPVTLKIPVTIEEGVTYIPIEFLSEFYGIEINYLQENNVIMVDFANHIKKFAEPIDSHAVVRKEKTIKAPILRKYDIQNEKPEALKLNIYEEYDKWYKVRTSEGIVGYIEKKYVIVKGMSVNKLPQEPPVDNAWKPEQGKINLVWEMMYSKKPDLAKIPKMEGLDVISPTWFQVSDDKGTLICRADAKYVEWAHKNGYKVWALLSNDFQNPEATKKLLNNTDARDNVIRQLLAFAALYKFDGINIDFENVNKDDRDALTQFVREATPFMKEQGLIVSIDVGVPDGSDNYSLCYDRKALGEVVDYVMVMTYDQHWSTSPKAGSVAQVSWVEKNLQKTLEVVPKEKLLLGLPFYTRLWKEESSQDGKTKVSSQAMTMEAAKKAIKDNNGTTKWDEESGQFYGEYKKDNATYKVWLEDDNSINMKSALAQKYNLAGVASWSRTYETAEVWNVLNKNLKVLDSYQAWVSENKDKKYVFN